MSEVRQGTDTVLDRAVAVKLFRGDADPRSEKRFEREARILARLQHPNVVTVFDAGSDGDERFIVMELVEGQTLGGLIDGQGRLRPDRASAIAERIAAALEYAHDGGIVHRDVKPSNILLAPSGDIKLADVGIAKVLSDIGATLTTGVFGTFSYIAPEQARGDAVDGRADVYALGCVLFEMLAGRPPFEGDGPSVLYAHANEPPPSLRSLAPAASHEMEQLVASMLTKEPADRPTARDVRERLVGAVPPVGDATATANESEIATVRHEPPAPTTPLPATKTPGLPRRTWPLLPIGVVAAIALIAGLFLFATLLASDDAPRRPDRPQAAPTPTRSVERSLEATSSPPPPDAPNDATPDAAGAAVLSVLDEGIAAGEIGGSISGDVRQKVEEIFRELDEQEGVEKGLEKIAELRSKIQEALDRGEITSADRAAALDEALARFAGALSEN